MNKSEVKRSHKGAAPQLLSRLKPRSADEIAAIISALYNALPLHIAIHLIHPNVVLAVAGLKGIADVHLVSQDKQSDKQCIDEANAEAERYGVQILFEDALDDSDPYVALTIVSLKGVEFASSRMPHLRARFNFPKYNAETGFGGLITWKRKVEAGLEAALSRGELTSEEKDILEQGILLGYPEQAIEDFEQCHRSGDIHKDLVSTDLISAHPLAAKFQGSVPEFDYYPKSKNNKQTVEYIRLAKDVIRSFYDHKWMQERAKDPAFNTAVERANWEWNAYLDNVEIEV